MLSLVLKTNLEVEGSRKIRFKQKNPTTQEWKLTSYKYQQNRKDDFHFYKLRTVFNSFSPLTYNFT